MVNSANTECLLCGALARGHFVPLAAIHTSEIERPLASEKQTLEYAQSNGRNRPQAVVRESSSLQTFRYKFLSSCLFLLSLLEYNM
jgi:hypothetical protein